jgi:hypothetical protein
LEPQKTIYRVANSKFQVMFEYIHSMVYCGEEFMCSKYFYHLQQKYRFTSPILVKLRERLTRQTLA